jgi:hypothetical protein
MKVMLVIPMKYYSALVHHCAVLWPEYRVLKNGIIVHRATGDHVEVLCDATRVSLIMNLAGRVCAEAIPHIQQKLLTGSLTSLKNRN